MIDLLLWIHIVSFCWVISRWHAPKNAWKPDMIDAAIGFIAASSWLGNMSDTIAEDPPKLLGMGMEIFAALVLAAGIYGSLMWVFIRVRVFMGEYLRHDGSSA